MKPLSADGRQVELTQKKSGVTRWIGRMRELRLLLWAGAVVFGIGAGLDLAIHALLPASSSASIQAPGLAEILAHTLTLVGMMLLLAGVLTIPWPLHRAAKDGERPTTRR